MSLPLPRRSYTAPKRGWMLFLSSCAFFPNSSNPGTPSNRPAAAARRQRDVVRNLRLIDQEPGDEVVAQAGIDGEPIGHAPVVLDVDAVLIHRQVRRRTRLVARHAADRAVDIVGQVRVGVVGAAGGERDVQLRLVDEVDARPSGRGRVRPCPSRATRSRRGTGTCAAAVCCGVLML